MKVVVSELVREVVWVVVGVVTMQLPNPPSKNASTIALSVASIAVASLDATFSSALAQETVPGEVDGPTYSLSAAVSAAAIAGHVAVLSAPSSLLSTNEIPA